MSGRYWTKIAVLFVVVFLVVALYVVVNNGPVVAQTARGFIPKRGPEVAYNVVTAAPRAEPESDPDYRIPLDDVLNQMDENGHMGVYWKYINNLQALCKSIIRVGSLKDGGKEICVDSGYEPKAPCTVYSFGINYQFDFDRAVADIFGCNVYCFDPSMKNNSYQVSDKIWFFKIGIGNKNYVNQKGWEIKTLSTIREELGHTNTTIDIMKIDVEGDEWNSLPEMISSGALDDVKQISMETHAGRTRPGNRVFWGNAPVKTSLQVLRLLYDSGYRIIMRERNFWSLFLWPIGYMTNVNEVTLIKVK